MSGFLYFLPTDKRAADAQMLKAAGLEYSLAADESIGSRFTTAGPGGQQGLVIVHNADGLDATYKPDLQIWRKALGGKVFVGRLKDSPIGPDDLKRDRVYEGQAVKLMDGNLWIIPRCFAVLEDRPATLPQIIDLDEESDRAITRIHPRFEALCRGAFDFWLEWSDQKPDEKASLSGEALLQLAIDALAVNYRLSRVEAVGCLSLVGTDQLKSMLRAMIDADEIENFAKAQQDQKKST